MMTDGSRAVRQLIGTDEAGYGPNLGPLVITATTWEIPHHLEPESLWHPLQDVLTNQPARNDLRLFVADSKAVYSSSRNIADLELPVLAFFSTLQVLPQTIDELASRICADFNTGYSAEPWNSRPGCRLPVEASTTDLKSWPSRLETAMAASSIHLKKVASRVIFPAEFNLLTEASGSKGAVLSDATLQLVRDSIDTQLPNLVVCDKHGGRNRYDALIASQFDDQFVFRLEESREVSRYRMGQTEFCFRTRAEELLPVALSSMISKYLREVLMRQFNQFWQTRIPGLQPTQGYPVDARRFRAEIAGEAAVLGIPDHLLWRNR